jgi:hypothetical protein
MRRIEGFNRQRQRELRRATGKTLAQESDDEVRANIAPELAALFERVKGQIKASDRWTRTEAFLHYAEEHPDEQLEAIEHETDKRLRELEQKEREASRAVTPSKKEVLSKLVEVLERQELERGAEVATREARAVTDESVLAAIRQGEHTWRRLHEFFPEHQWQPLHETIERLQRERRIHLDANLDFRLGARPEPWKVQQREPYEMPKPAAARGPALKRASAARVTKVHPFGPGHGIGTRVELPDGYVMTFVGPVARRKAIAQAESHRNRGDRSEAPAAPPAEDERDAVPF